MGETSAIGTLRGRTLQKEARMRAGIALPLLAGALLAVSGCASGGQGAAGTDTETVTSTREASSAASEAPSAAPVSSTSGEPPTCTNAPAVNPLTGEQPIPITYADSPSTDGRFFYAPSGGAPDSCTPLSWVKLSGTKGQEGSGPGATAGSSAETVALFGDGALVSDPAPILARRIESVERIDAATIRVNYAFPTDQPAAVNDTAPGSATFHWDGARITVSDNTLPAELNGSAATLELSGVR